MTARCTAVVESRPGAANTHSIDRIVEVECVIFGDEAGRLSVMANNVLGGELEPCSTDPLTGFTRTGCCDLHPQDGGFHIVCAVVTNDFLAFSKEQGNDLSTPRPEFHFPGLTAGDRWCLCASRWVEAFEAGVAPKVVLEATHAQTLEWIDIADLRAHAV